MNFEEITKYRPKPKRQYGQLGCTAETLEKRARLLSDQGDLKNKRILFLGDYDLTALACLPKAENSEIWVLDIDADVLSAVREGTRPTGLPREASAEWGAIQTIAHDLRNPLPKRLRGYFEVVFTDPPYSPEGIALFLSRAIEALGKDGPTSSRFRGVKKIYLCYGTGEKARDRALKIQKIITEMGLLIQEVLPGFNLYPGARDIGGKSHLFILLPTPQTKPLVKGVYSAKIYSFE